jgi:predicted peptidase
MDPLEFVYKRVDTLELKLDVYLPADASQEKPAPICIWWHGGGRKSHLLSSIVKELISQFFRYVQFALCFK